MSKKLLIVVIMIALIVTGALFIQNRSRRSKSEKELLCKDIERFVYDNEQWFDENRLASKCDVILSGISSCLVYRFGQVGNTDSLVFSCKGRLLDSLIQDCFPTMVAKLQQRFDGLESQINSLRILTQIEENRLLSDAVKLLPDSISKSFKRYLSVLNVSIDSLNHAYLVALRTDSTGVWERFLSICKSKHALAEAITYLTGECGQDMKTVNELALECSEEVRKEVYTILRYCSYTLRWQKKPQ